ncbi:putative derlin [Helianthus annuus]|uniref:Derlin n=1 Tax=Helianthus annuus TaxID=4232 RepID=A0A251SMB4_HELAN|nr:derlin-1 [Helianthus annuus]KAF5771244.1 putative derlin [Helianthus annuus]KAJ0487665.1 putative derlin, Rhomboid-like superfamily [Helianthus annuus]
MSTPAQYYNSLPPVAKTYATVCLVKSLGRHLQLYSPTILALSYEDVFKRFQIWRLITNFIFIGSFSFTFAFRLFIILKYGVQLERGPFDKRTADYVWMFFFGAFSLLAISAIPFLWSPFMGASLVFMIVYVWSRELPNTRINFHGLVEFKGVYLPWTMLAIELVLGNPLIPSLLGIGVGHLYYFLTVLYPLAGGNDICKTPFWVHKLVKRWGRGYQINSPVKQNESTGGAFQGRSYRVGGTSTARDPSNLGAFSGRSRRLAGR